MKIFDAREKKQEIKPKRRKSSSGSTIGGSVEGSEKKAENFSNVFSLKVEKINDEFIHEMVSEIERAGSALEKSASVADFNKYRSLIRKLFKKIIPNAYSVDISHSRPSVKNLQRKEYHIVKVVDNELDSLLEMINSREKKNLKIASQVIKIKGLIIDVLK